MSDTGDKQPTPQTRIPIVVTSQRVEDRYRVDASKTKAKDMGASSRILRLFE
jgi:hypothetical protein